MKKLRTWITTLGITLTSVAYGLTKEELQSEPYWNEDAKTLELMCKTLSSKEIKEVVDYCIENGADVLALQSCDIDTDGAKVLADNLNATKLMELDLKLNNIGDAGTCLLADALMANTTLAKLNLSFNNMSRDGAKALADVLKTNTTLVELDLSNNKIEWKGAKALADALEINDTLMMLDLGFNRIGGIGAGYILKVLEHNNTLTELDLRNNLICILEFNSPSNIAIQTAAYCLKSNQTLTTLNLEYNGIGDAGERALAEALKANTTITELSL